MSKSDSNAWAFIGGAWLLAVSALFVAAIAAGTSDRHTSEISVLTAEVRALKAEKCHCKPAPTPAPCCKADECRQEFAKVDARFGGVWDELVEVQEQLAKVKACDCGPVKECACDPVKAQLPRHLIFKRCK